MNQNQENGKMSWQPIFSFFLFIKSHRNIRYMCEQDIFGVLYLNVKMIENTTN